MSIKIPSIDDRKYQDILNEALARIPVHNPEWTNFNKSDPGVTIIEIFSFLTESLLYRSNQIPERNRRKFLSLLGMQPKAPSSAQGIVGFANDRGPLQIFTLSQDLTVLSGKVPFQTTMALDVLPIEAQAFYKCRVDNPSQQLINHYNQLYESYRNTPQSAKLDFYELKPFPSVDGSAIDLDKDKTVDGALWVALMTRQNDKPTDDFKTALRKLLAGKTLSIGIVPLPPVAASTLTPGGTPNPASQPSLTFEMPFVKPLPKDPLQRKAAYRTLDALNSGNVLSDWCITQLTLPAAEDLGLWDDLEPLESGVGDFPPSLDDSSQSDRIITWVRIKPTAAGEAKLLWAGINAALVNQKTRVFGEVLQPGTGEPDQIGTLSKTPVIADSVILTITPANGTTEIWQRIDDIACADPEIPVSDPRLPPGSLPLLGNKSKVFSLDQISGEIKFGSGLRGYRPPRGAAIRADYDYSTGTSGNVGKATISSGQTLPAGITVQNPLPTWGGADPETTAECEKQISQYLQHRDRLVTGADFDTIVRRTPSIEIGRVDVLSAYNPDLSPNEPGGAPGAVTLMVVPKTDPIYPLTPIPDNLFRKAICEFIEPRRLVTTEVFVRGPVYKGIWISIGVSVLGGVSVAQVREDIKKEVYNFLSPLPDSLLNTGIPSGETFQYPERINGWPLRKAVIDQQLMVVASRIQGVLTVNKVLLAIDLDKTIAQSIDTTTTITLSGLELPRILGLSVTLGEPMDINQLRGSIDNGATSGGTTPLDGGIVQVPIILEGCI